MVKFYLFLLFVCVIASAIAQNGPGGIGNATGANGQPENIIWLDAGTLAVGDGNPVLTWPDLSGNNNDLIQLGSDPTPLFEANGLFSSNYKAVRFDGTERYLTLADNADLDNNLAGITIISVIYNATLDGSARGIYSKRVNSSSQESYSVFTHSNRKLNFDIRNTGDNRLISTDALNTTTDYILTNSYDGSIMRTFIQTNASGTRNTSGNIANTFSDFIVGALNENYGTYFDGDIAELIIYRGALNGGERLIVENYLSQKYNISITNDFFGTDVAYSASFSNGLMGIGTADGSEKLSSSGNSDALQVEETNNSLDAVNEFVMFAHGNTAHADGVTADITVDPGILDSRWARSWYVEVTGQVTTKMRFDFGTAGLVFSGDATDYVLLFRPTTGDNYTRMPTDLYSVENGDQLVVDLSNASLRTGYYTIGEGEQLTINNWYSYQSGDWNDPLTWTTISNGSLREPIIGGIPEAGDNVTVLSGRTVTMDTDDNDGVNLTVDGRLDIVNTSGHNFFNILGSGVISIAGDGSQNDNFPSGSTAVFADSIVGGTVEIVGEGLNLDRNRLYNNVIVNLDNSSDIATLLADYTINGDLTIQSGVFRINNNSATTSRNITVYGDVQVDTSSEINVGTADARHEFNFYANLTNNGKLEFTNRSAPDFNNEATDGIIDANFLSDNTNQGISCNGITNFYRIEIDKGDDQTYILDINSVSVANFNLFGPVDYAHGEASQLTTNNNALGLLRGTVRLNENVDVPRLNNTGNCNISEAARLWVNGGSTMKTGGEAIVAYGTIQVSGGTLDAPVRSGVTMRDNGTLNVSGGTVTINQLRTSTLGPTNIGGYVQSGGTVDVTGNNVQQDYYTFNLTYPGNTFNMSGGTLKVAGADNFNDHTGGTSGQVHGGSIFINSNPGNVSVTGGTVIMENSTNIDFKVTSRAPFWNVIMRSTGGSATEVNMDGGTSGDNAPGEFETILTPSLKVLNDLTIESGVIFDHNGYNVEIGSDFNIENGGEYIYANNRKNTTTINGTDNSLLNFQNRISTGAGDEQRFWNLVIDKPHNKTVSLASGKADLTKNNNNLIRIQGNYFKLLGGTLDQGVHSVRLYADTLVNYDILTVYNSANYGDDPASNGDNDILKFRDDNQPTVIITADSSRFGAVKLNSVDEIITFNSNVKIDYLDYRYGRINIQNYNLTVDFIDENLNKEAAFDLNSNGTIQNFEKRIFNPADMLISDGKASDGGLSIYIGANGTYTFPLGIGTDADSLDRGTSKYTPGLVTITNFVDDGYITMHPVDKVLSTTNSSGGDILSYYWKIDYNGFSTLPKVEYQFIYYDEDLDGSANETNFVPGSVLNNKPFTRSYEDDGVPESEFIDATNNTIIFNGQNDTGLTLVSTNYTAGQPGRFLGNVEVFYTRTYNAGYASNWTNTAFWTLATNDIDGSGTVDADEVHDSRQPPAGNYPKAGDIAVVGWVPWGDPAGNNGKPHGIAMNSTQNIAELRFTPMTDIAGNPTERVYAYNFQFRPTVVINPGGAFDPASGTIISGEGLFWLRSVGGGQVDPDFSLVDIGDFVETDSSYFIYEATQNFTYNNIPEEVPNLMIAGDGWGAQDRDFGIATDVTIKKDFELLGDVNLILSSGSFGDISVEGDLNIFRNNANGNDSGGFGEIAYPNSTSRSIEVFGDLKLINQGALIHVRSANAGINESQLTVHGNILQNSATGGTDGLQLYSGANLDYIKLVLRGTGNHNFTNVAGDQPSFFNIKMDKGASQTSTFTFNNSFSLNGPTDQAAKALELLNGAIVLNDPNITINLTTGGGDFDIPSSAGLEIRQGSAYVSGDDTGISLDGLLRISGVNAELNLDVSDSANPGNGLSENGNNFIEYSASGNALLEISSGTLTVGSQIRPITSAETGVLKYRQTGGDVRIGTQAGTVNNRGMLQIYNTGSEFTYTGGTLTIERHQSSPSVAALYLDPDNSNVSGSTITIFNANTPAGQDDFRVNSVIALDNLTINGNNAPGVLININPLTISNQLTIVSGATLNGNARTLTVGGDMVNDGTYNAQSNETVFNSAGTQQISGSGINNFFRFTKSSNGTLQLTHNIDVDGLFTISDGILSDNGFSINLAADAVVDGTHASLGGNGLVFSGSANQELRRSTAGTGTLGVISINNPNGLTIPDGNGYNFNINGGLRLQDGVFNVGGGFIFLGVNADITPVNPFSVDNMIQTNSSFVDSGVGKQFAASHNQDFVFPVGQEFYTPVSFDFATPGNTFGSSTGNIVVRPANEYHPTVNDGTDVLATGDINNVLQYYWTVTANGVNGLKADMMLQYDQSLVLEDEPGVSYEENDYFAARILSFNNPMNNINKFDATYVDEASNRITFNFNGSNSNGISGDYFAGLDEAIPNNVVTYIAISGGGDVDQEIYDIPLPNGAGVPPSGAVVIIPNGNTVRLNIDNIRLYKTEIQAGGVLEVDNTTNHRLGTLEGTGTLKIVSDGINANLPAFSGNFLSCSGGGLEYAGTGSYNVLGGITSLRKLTLSGDGNRNFPNNDVEICEDLVVDGPDMNVKTGRRVDIRGGVELLAGSIYAPSGSSGRFNVFGTGFAVSGGVFTGGSSGITNILGDLILNGGMINIGSSNYEFRIGGDFTFTSGTFNGGSNNAFLEFTTYPGNGVVKNSFITGDFTGANVFRNVRVDKGGSGKSVLLQSDIGISNRLELIAGKIIANGNTVTLGATASVNPEKGKSNSYITGKVIKENISSGSDFVFPIGSISNWRPASLNSVTTGGLDWEVQYFNDPPTNDSRVDNMTPTSSSIKTLSTSEYWIISDGNAGASGVNANVGLSWGFDSDVSASSSEREELEVMVWNDGTSSWDNYGGANFSGGHTQSAGSFESSSPVSFSEHVFTLGSGDEANPLPITLKAFWGKNMTTSNYLYWTTSSEINNDYFELQRSVDGENYTDIATIKGSGTSKSERDYQYIDEDPVAGKNYYRLKQVDFDGGFSISNKIVLLDVEHTKSRLSLTAFPNPTNENNINLRINIEIEYPVLVKLFDIYGRVCFSKEYQPLEIKNDIKLDTGQKLKQGIYIITAEQGLIKANRKVVINR